MTTAPSSPPDPPRPALARLVELALVVPVEVGARLVEAVPAVVDKVPSAAQRVRREVVLARFLGKMVVDQGVRELRERLSPTTTTTSPPTTTTPTTTTLPGSSGDADAPATALPTDTATDTLVPEVPEVESLALADYDHLSSAQIVGKLEDLEPDERSAIERYERARRHRRTILGKLDQLRTAAP